MEKSSIYQLLSDIGMHAKYHMRSLTWFSYILIKIGTFDQIFWAVGIIECTFQHCISFPWVRNSL